MSHTRVQNYRNHAHLPKAATAAGAFAAAALVGFAWGWAGRPSALYPSLIALTIAVILLVAISRLYIVALQNRIIRLEMRVRLKELLPPSRHADIARLETPQLVGLRFASDAELPALVDRTLRENLTRDQIKQAVTDWQADWHRT